MQGVTALTIELVVLSTQGFTFVDDDFRDPVKAAKEAWHVAAQINQQAGIVGRFLPPDMHRVIAPGCCVSFWIFLSVYHRMGHQSVLGVIPHQLVYGLGLRLVINPDMHGHIATKGLQAKPTGES